MQHPTTSTGASFNHTLQSNSEEPFLSFPKEDPLTDSSNASPSTTTGTSVPRIRRRNRMITSCLECRRRKMKCDKSHPCTNCTRFSRDCVFLAPALDSASQLKLTEIKEKMGSLEKVLEQDVAMKASRKDQAKGGFLPKTEEIDFAPEPEDEKHLEQTPLASMDAVYEDDADDDLMDLGIQLGKLRLTDRLGGFFRPKISEEITVGLIKGKSDRRSPREKSELLESYATPKLYNFLAPGPTYIAPSSGFFFAVGNQGTSLIDFLPSRLAADRLLQQYWYAVHPIARMVHRPSFERRYETFWNEVQMGIEPVGSLQAVVFATMFSGVVSMPEEVILRDFGVAKKALEESFQQGTETALTRANILRATKVETLQAFVMYMIPLCRDQLSRSHSALCGTAIRLAECIGLHRDGSEYGFTAVETHVRRLVWYQLCLLDIRTCEAQGPRPGIRREDYDTKLPLNVDDIELDQRHPPIKSSERWTDMTLSLMRMECNEMHRVIWVDRARLEKKQISLTVVLGKIENFKKMMYEKYSPLIDENIPIQKCGRIVLNLLISRMHIMVLHRYYASNQSTIPDRLRQLILTSGTEQIESAMILETDPAVRPWAWYAGALNQYHTALLLLSEVYVFPMRKEADRIWKVLDYIFEMPPGLSRPEKSRLILTEIRDRIGAYNEARKVRVPPGVLQQFGQQPPRPADDEGDNLPTTPSRLQLMVPALHPTPRATNGEYRSMLPAETPRGPENISDTNTSAGSIPDIPQPISMSDDLMADIDWNEWDKLFPPDINTGDLDII